MSQTSFEKWKFAGGLPEVLVVNGPYPLIPMGAGLPPYGLFDIGAVVSDRRVR